jgi:hypothetical protein
MQLDVLSNGNSLHEVAHIANGSHPGNCISLLRINVSFVFVLCFSFFLTTININYCFFLIPSLPRQRLNKLISILNKNIFSKQLHLFNFFFFIYIYTRSIIINVGFIYHIIIRFNCNQIILKSLSTVFILSPPHFFFNEYE